MKSYCTFFLLSVFYALCYSELFAQVTIDAEFRPRTEFKQGYKKPVADSLDGVLTTVQRTRLNAGYKTGDLLARLSLQDTHIWGNTNNKVNTSKFEVFEAWFEYLFTPDFSLKMGRQPLAYDDQRLFSAANWSSTGTAHDILLLKYKCSGITAHSGFAYNNEKDTLINVNYGYTPKQNYKALWYFWLSKKVISGTTLSLTGVYEGFEKPNDYRVLYPRLTYGLFLSYSSDSSSWSGSITAHLQKGKNPTVKYKGSYADLSAYFLAAKLSYDFTSSLSGTLGFDYYSGTASDAAAGESNSYNKLYGSNHSYNGFMDFYSTLPSQGLADYYACADLKITKQFSAGIAGHIFYFDKDFIYSGSKTDKNLGSEMDLTLKYKASKAVSIQGGYSLYFDNATTKKYFKLNNTEIHKSQWAYLMFTVKPQFFTSEK